MTPTRFAYVCRYGHAEIGFNELRQGQCPLCIVKGQMERMMDIIKEDADRRAIREQTR